VSQISPDALLVIYGQNGPHDEVRILANRAGLEKLVSVLAITLSSENSEGVDREFLPPDGEAFYVRVKILEKPFGDSAWHDIEPWYAELLW
jgi:hypothetical protein